MQQHKSSGWHNTQLESAQWRSCQLDMQVQQHNSSGRHKTQLESAQWRSCQLDMQVQQHNSSGWHKNNWNLLREEAVNLAYTCNSTTVQDDTKTTGICYVKKLSRWHAHATAQQFRTTQKQLESVTWRSCQLACTCNSTTVQDDTKHNWNQLSEEAVNWTCKCNSTTVQDTAHHLLADTSASAIISMDLIFVNCFIF